VWGSQLKHIFCIYCVRNCFLWVTPAILNLPGRNFTQWLGSDGTLPWILCTTSFKSGQNDPEKNKRFCQRDSASEMLFISGQFAWNFDTLHESMLSILSKKNFKIFPYLFIIPPKPTYSGVFQWVSCYKPTDKLMHFWVRVTIPCYTLRAQDVPLSGDLGVWVTIFWVTGAENIPKVWFEQIGQCAILVNTCWAQLACWVPRVATRLENLEKSGNSKVAREKSGKMMSGKLKSVSLYSATTNDTSTDTGLIYCIILHLLQPQCIKCRILKAQWLPGLLLINVKQRLLTIALNSIACSSGICPQRSVIHRLTADPRFAAGFCIHSGCQRDDCNVSSWTC